MNLKGRILAPKKKNSFAKIRTSPPPQMIIGQPLIIANPTVPKAHIPDSEPVWGPCGIYVGWPMEPTPIPP